MNSSVSPQSCARVRISIFAAAVVFGFATLGAAEAATSPPVVDTYITLSLPGVVGDFTTVPNAPANSIQVVSLSTGASCTSSSGGAGAGTCNVEGLSILKLADSASPKLFQALVTGVSYATAAINFWEAPTSGTNYTNTFTIYLTHAGLQSFQLSGAGGGSPGESLSFTFGTIAFKDNVSGSVVCYNVTTKSTTNALTC